MQINPFRQLLSLCANKSDTTKPEDSATAKATKLAEESTYFAHMFKVRAEDIAPLLWNRFYKDLRRKHKRKLRRVNKKKPSAEPSLRKRDHDPDDQATPDYV
ncbi:hypothetical protein [Candidatus Sororendozoicomonas aggregata]|uniref:hypothetical protein n=1 Tax=Candidatus Sororendozoicomonas aggregata TaxID=3073239 RepID=UPI002ED05C0B